MGRRIGVFLIRVYQKSSRWMPPTCRFTPSCSNYTLEGKTTIGDVTISSQMELTENLIPISYEASSGQGTLRVHSGVPDAVIRVDEGPPQTGEWSGEVRAGPHRVVVQARGYSRVTAIGFPAYVRLEEPGVERKYYAFFVSTVGGPLGSGARVFPFWADTRVAGRQETRYVMWPFHIRTRRLLPGEGWEERRLDEPVYAAIDGPTSSSSSASAAMT